jgi:acyl-coenzyme A thioesterase PaaI-like protein
MQKLRNPYTQMDGYNCFGCSPNNITGLRMEFTDDGEQVSCVWKPQKAFQGYKDLLHGGIQMTMMDEIASWVVQAKLGTAGVTSKIETRFLKPVFISDDFITLRAKVKDVKRNMVFVEAGLYNSKEVLCSQSLVVYFTFTTELAGEKYFYPGRESFYSEPNDQK